LTELGCVDYWLRLMNQSLGGHTRTTRLSQPLNPTGNRRAE
jgi:hypothetical protein